MIIETLAALRSYLAHPGICPACRKEATDLLRLLTNEGVNPVAIHFDTDCEHQGALWPNE